MNADLLNCYKLIIPFSFFLLYCTIVSFSGIFIYALAAKAELKGEKQFPLKTTQYSQDRDNPVLLVVHSVFPFDLFPDTYVIQEKTISVIRKKFFFSGWAETLPVEDIGSIRLYAGPFLASLIIAKRLPIDILHLNNLWKKDAIRVKEIIDGLILKENKIIDVPSAKTSKEKREIIFEVGRTKEVEKEI